ncbi:MAG TPA: hypothetical protein VH502_08785 [Actinoplanes sp.]
MTGNQFSAVDFDLLADFVGGALDGTPDHHTVADLVAHDPAWRAAHADLATGMTAVGDRLSALGAASEPMPTDLAVRLEEAFRTAAQAPRLEPISGGVPSRAPAKRRRRWRWAVPIAAAAGVLAFAGVGVDYLAGRSNTATDSQTSSAGGAARPEGAPMVASGVPQVAAPPAGDQIRSTGADYDTATLASGIAGRVEAPPAKSATVAPGVAGETGAPLARLRARDALLGCLNAIATANGAGTITVQTVDYARFQGKPALVVRFSAANGSWAWASGPGCGAPAGDAATLASVPVG